MSNLRKTSLYLLLLWGSALLAASCGQAHREQQATTRPPFEVTEASIADVQQALKRGDCNCEQLVQAYQARIGAYDQPTHLNAIVVTNPVALAEARQLDAEYRRTGKLRPLHCVPLIVKDNYNTAGLQTAAGSLALKDFVPTTDATMVRDLKAAGAIVLAKSNMAEWAFSPLVTISSLAGETRNPYNLAHVPAGSSGSGGQLRHGGPRHRYRQLDSRAVVAQCAGGLSAYAGAAEPGRYRAAVFAQRHRRSYGALGGRCYPSARSNGHWPRPRRPADSL